MSARRDDLIELLAKVKAGSCSNDGSMYRVFGADWCHSYDAYNGNLNAAKALHEAVLPDWRWRFDDKYGDGSPEEYWYRTAWVSSPHSWRTGQTSRVKFGNDARAWLIAILKALISQDTTQEGKP